jgi:hypothetical protein
VPASRLYWRGYLKLSFVSCPIALYPAISAAERISFRQVNRRTGHRLKQKLVDSVTGQAIDSADKARGHEVGETIQSITGRVPASQLARRLGWPYNPPQHPILRCAYVRPAPIHRRAASCRGERFRDEDNAPSTLGSRPDFRMKNRPRTNSR